MENKNFKFTVTGEGISWTSYVNLNYLIQSVDQESVLFLLMKEQREELQPLNVPVIKSKDRIVHETQIRNVKDFFTIKITDLEAIQRFRDYMSQNCI